MDHWTVGERIGERDAELDEIRAGIRVGEADLGRGGQIGEAAHQVGHQGGSTSVGPSGCERLRDPLDAA
jgi:hypothetical protein